jgi:hypothetical protein
MLEEHHDIVVALETLAEAGHQENKPAAGKFAEKLKQHAKSEEEILYPAAILVGEVIRMRRGR